MPKTLELTCKQCGKTIFIYPSQSDKKYCSLKCAHIGTKGKSHKRQIKKFCKICNKEFLVPPSRANAVYCSKKCLNNSKIGQISKKRIKFELEKIIIKDYKDNIPLAELLKKHNIGNTTLFRILNRNNIKRRGYPEQRVKRITTLCKFCNKEIKSTPALIKAGRGKYHKKCYEKKLSEEWTLHTPWNKGSKGVMKSWKKGLTKADPRVKAPKTAFKKGNIPPFKGIPLPDEIRKKLSISTKRNYEKRPELKEMARAALRKARRSFSSKKRTDIEVAMLKLLTAIGYTEGVDFVQQQQIGEFTPDFVFPDEKIVIECRGDYHHANPTFNDTSKLTDMQIRHNETFERKEKYLLSQGYKLLWFWGSNIKKNAGNTMFVIKKEIEESRGNKIDIITFDKEIGELLKKDEIKEILRKISLHEKILDW